MCKSEEGVATKRRNKTYVLSLPLEQVIKMKILHRRPCFLFCSQIGSSSESNVPVWRSFAVARFLLFPPLLNSPWRALGSVKAVSFWSLSLPVAWVPLMFQPLTLSHAQQIIKNKVAFLEKSWLTDLFRNIPYSFSADPLALALEVVWNSLAAREGGWIVRYLFTPHC